jgi:hypothetical protein
MPKTHEDLNHLDASRSGRYSGQLRKQSPQEVRAIHERNQDVDAHWVQARWFGQGFAGLAFGFLEEIVSLGSTV